MALPVSTAQMIAQRNVNQLQQARAQGQGTAPSAVAQQPNFGNASNPIGLISSGLGTLGQTLNAPGQREAQQAQLASQAEQVGYNRSQDALTNARADLRLAGEQEIAQGNLKLGQGNLNLGRAQESRLQQKFDVEQANLAEQKINDALKLKTNTGIENLIQDAINPVLAQQEVNKKILGVIEGRDDINVTYDPVTNEPIVSGTGGDSDIAAKNLSDQLKSTAVIGDTAAFSRQLEQLRLAGQKTSATGDDLSPEQIKAYRDQYDARFAEVNNLTKNEATKLKGVTDAIDTKYQEELTALTGAKGIDTGTFQDIQNYSAAKVQGGPGFAPKEEFMAQLKESLKGSSQQADTLLQVNNQINEAVAEAKEEAGTEWDHAYEDLAVANALRGASVGDKYFDIGAYDLQSDNFIALVKEEMVKINATKGINAKAVELKNKYDSQTSSARLRALGSSGKIIRN